MSLLKKNKEPKYDHTEKGELGYNIYIDPSDSRYMQIEQRVWQYVDGDSFDTPTASFRNIPVADVKKALIRHELTSRGIIAYEGDYELKMVPAKDSAPGKLDAVGLKDYREKVEALTKAKIGLGNARDTFGWQSEPAKWAEKLVGNLEEQVDEAYRMLSGATGGNASGDD